MPCRSGYHEPSKREIESIKVMDFLYHEAKLIRLHGSHGIDGYYATPDVKDLDEHTALLCDFCKNAEDITKCSLELQIWWRDHLIADERRLERERKEAEMRKKREEAASKLTDEERKILGIKF